MPRRVRPKRRRHPPFRPRIPGEELPRCGAQLRGKPGRFCRQTQVCQNGRCYLHGGLSLGGIAAPLRTGRYSAQLPVHLTGPYERAIHDPEIHSLRGEVGLAQVRVEELLKRAETSDLGHAWTQLSTVWQELQRCRTHGDVPGMQVQFDLLSAIVERGQADYLLWQEIISTVKVLSTLRLSEHRRLVDLQAMMSAEDAKRLWTGTQLVVRDNILRYADTDTARQILTAIQADLVRLDTREHGVVRSRLGGADPATG